MSKVIMKWNKKSSEWKIFSKTNIKFGTKYQASAIPLTSGIKSWCNDDSSLLPRGSGKCESKCGIAKSQIPVQSRITGGKATIINQYPWMAMIIMKEGIFLTTTHFRGSSSSAGLRNCSSHTTITSLQPRRQLLGQSSQGHILCEEIICRMKRT